MLHDNVVMTYCLRFVAALAMLQAAHPCYGQELDENFDTQAAFVVHGSGAQAERVAGIEGFAWRSNGYSSFLSASAQFDGDRFIGAVMWVALESYPSDNEAPVRNARPSSFIVQQDDGHGFDLWIDTYGRWGARIATTSGRIELVSEDPFPLYAWSQVGFGYDPATGTASLFLNGKAVAQSAGERAFAWRPAHASVMVARPAELASLLNFDINLLNGAFDQIVVTQDAEKWTNAIAWKPHNLPGAQESLRVAGTRFASDHLRPRFHAMPPANWTNEPHGLVLLNGRYHLFYQRTPNGPFKTQMVWGHMSSTDLVHWTHHRDAIRPTLQTPAFGFDMKGIWSGDVIVDRNIALAFYTSVNHGPREAYNPGISIAISNDSMLREWQKRGPVIDTRHVEDFRDPYLWQEGSAWHMIIGADFRDGGGLDYYTCNDIADFMHCWTRQKRFSSVPFARMDVGSAIWEMPVFESIAGRHLLIVNPIGGKVAKYGNPATRGVYWLGTWADGLFTPDAAQPRNLDVLPGHLSPTVARMPGGGLVGIGIVDERRTPQAQEDAGWAHTFSLPREYYVNAAGVLGQRPLAALASLRGAPQDVAVRLGGQAPTFFADPGHQYEATLNFRAADGPFGLVIMGNPDGSEQTTLRYDPATREIVLDKSRASTSGTDEGPLVLREAFDVAAFGDPQDWRIFVDGSVVDVFIGDGAAFSFRSYPAKASSTRLGVIGAGGQVDGTLWRMAPASFSYDFSESPDMPD